MLDIKKIRQNPQWLIEGLQKRGVEDSVSQVETLLLMDQQYRSMCEKTQSLQQNRHLLAKQIVQDKGSHGQFKDMVEKGKILRDELNSLEEEKNAIHSSRQNLLASFPNVPSDDVPHHTEAQKQQGKSVKFENTIESTWGSPPVFSFEPKNHELLGKNLHSFDQQRASSMSGSRFVILQGCLALLERALGNFMVDVHTKEFDYEEVSPPYLVNKEAVYGVGQLPHFSEDIFSTKEGKWLISTGEVPLTNLARQQIFSETQLPLRYVAHTPCFRLEAGSAGRDTHGLIRLHQFHKVELVHITSHHHALAEYNHLLKAAQSILERLNLPYRTVLLHTRDMGPAAKKTYDLEVWMPGANNYLEVSSCSYCGDFQGRRMDSRWRCSQTKGVFYTHTLNGSGLAVGRTLAAVLENNQQEDGTILVPKALYPYVGDQRVLRPALQKNHHP